MYRAVINRDACGIGCWTHSAGAISLITRSYDQRKLVAIPCNVSSLPCSEKNNPKTNKSNKTNHNSPSPHAPCRPSILFHEIAANIIGGRREGYSVYRLKSKTEPKADILQRDIYIMQAAWRQCFLNDRWDMRFQ